MIQLAEPEEAGELNRMDVKQSPIWLQRGILFANELRCHSSTFTKPSF